MSERVPLKVAAQRVGRGLDILKRHVTTGKIPSQKDSAGRHTVLMDDVLDYYRRLSETRPSVIGQPVHSSMYSSMHESNEQTVPGSTHGDQGTVTEMLRARIHALESEVEREKRELVREREKNDRLQGELTKLTAELIAYLHKTHTDKPSRWVASEAAPEPAPSEKRQAPAKIQGAVAAKKLQASKKSGTSKKKTEPEKPRAKTPAKRSASSRA